MRRLRFASRSAYAVNKCRSAISAHWFHLAASRPHVALLSVDLAILAMARQSAAMLRSVSGVVITHAPRYRGATEKRLKGSRCAELLYGPCDCSDGTPKRSGWRGLRRSCDPRKPFIDIVARRSDWQNEERAAKPGGLGLAGGLDRLEHQLPVLTAG